jgi:hypothetical protein
VHPLWCRSDACTVDEAGHGSHASAARVLKAEAPNPQHITVTLVQAASANSEAPGALFVDLAFGDDEGELASMAVEMGLAEQVAQALLGDPASSPAEG